MVVAGKEPLLFAATITPTPGTETLKSLAVTVIVAGGRVAGLHLAVVYRTVLRHVRNCPRSRTTEDLDVEGRDLQGALQAHAEALGDRIAFQHGAAPALVGACADLHVLTHVQLVARDGPSIPNPGEAFLVKGQQLLNMDLDMATTAW